MLAAEFADLDVEREQLELVTRPHLRVGGEPVFPCGGALALHIAHELGESGLRHLGLPEPAPEPHRARQEARGVLRVLTGEPLELLRHAGQKLAELGVL